MAMKRCPICGENYSDTYKSCPFCEEEAALQRGNQLHRGGKGGKRASSGKKRGQPNLLSPVLVILILIMAALLVYLLFGDKIADKLMSDQTKDPTTEEVTPAPPTLDGNEDGTAPEVGTDTDGQNGADGTGDSDAQTDLSALPETLTMSYLGSPKTEFTMSVGDAPIPLTASGGSGSYTWSSSDESIATVDADGKVSAVAAGQATITVTDGSGKGTCMVRVKGGTAGGQTTTTTTPASSAPKLSSTDFTTRVGDPNVQLKVSGTSSSVTWASKNTGIATVSGSGVVKAVAAGTTTITATVDGKVLECIVRVTK